MSGPPPTFPLFPSTTLSRSKTRQGPAYWAGLRKYWSPGKTGRSEEHTSELQSLRHLVCRLLLEKKNGGMVVQGNGLFASDSSPLGAGLRSPVPLDTPASSEAEQRPQ